MQRNGLIPDLQVVCPSEHVIFDWNLHPSDG